MTKLHVVKVFVGPNGSGGNLLGVFLDGPAIEESRRQRIAFDLGFSETVFVDDAARGVVRIFLPTEEAAFAGHPAVGSAWLIGEEIGPIDVLRPPAGDVPVRYEGDVTWIRGRPEWLPGEMNIQELSSAAEVEAHPGQAMGTPWLYIWAWEDESAGRLRSRSFPTTFGILEDEASGAASVVMGSRIGRPLVIRQGVGSEIRVMPLDDGTVEIGGRTELVEVRDFS
jgi:predicted PhzF superfamily epimerase YddE/YHI9